MAERIGSRARRPPPVPKVRSDGQGPPPVPSKSRGPETVSEDIEVEEPTLELSAPAALSTIEEVYALLVDEAESLVIGGSDDRDQRLADVHVDLALLAQEILGDDDTAARYFDQIEGHPLAAALQRSRALACAEADDFDRAIASAEDAAGDTDRAALALDLAEAWLYRHGDAHRAAETARAALDDASADLQPGLFRVLTTALGVAEDWRDLEDVLAAAGDPASRAAAAQLAFDRLGDEARAIELLDGDGDGDGDGDATGTLGLYTTELLQELEVASDDGAVDGTSILLRSLELLAAAGADAEADATRYALVDRHLSSGDGGAARRELETLLATGDRAWGPALARRAALRLAQGQGDWDEVARHLRAVAESNAGSALEICYRRRLAELLEHRLDRASDAVDEWRRIFETSPSDPTFARAVEQNLLRGEPGPLSDHLAALAQRVPGDSATYLRLAAAVAERAGDAVEAVSLATQSATFDRFDLVRLHRRLGDRGAVANLFGELGRERDDGRAAAALLTIAGAVSLVHGRGRDAEVAFAAAAERWPSELGARLALAALCRASGKRDQLAGVLAEIAGVASGEALRFDVLRELGDVSIAAADAATACDAYERALELRPDDAVILHALAGLYDARREWERSVELRERAVDVLGSAPAAVAILVEIGRIEEDQRERAAAALEAFERACVLDPSAIEPLRACQRLYALEDRSTDLLRSLRTELELDPDSDRRLALNLDIARVAAASGRDTDELLSAYRAALAVDSENATALEGIETIAGEAGRWDVVAEVFAAARETASNVATLGKAYRELGDWKRFAEARRRHIALVADKAAKVELSLELAAVYDRELEDGAAAAATYKNALAIERANRHAQREVVRIHERAEQWDQLCEALEEELKTWSSAHVERQVEILLQIGELRRNRLSRSSEAALAYEQVLERSPDHPEAIEALEGLYRKLGRDKDLLRILDARASLGGTEKSDAELSRQIAELRERLGDIDGCVEAYLESFAAEPSSRETFTTLETLCYTHERWTDVMALYKRAIVEVEDNGLRAYRLGDLYARRGQVQFQYLGELGESAASYLRVIELDPDDDNAIDFLETIFSQQSDWSSLISAYEKRALLTQDRARKLDSLRRAGVVARTKSGDEGEAARVYRRILEVEPGDREAIDALERFYRRVQQWDQLVEILEAQLAGQTSDDDPVAIDLLERIAKISEEGLRDESRAIRYYQRLADADPNQKQALDSLSRIFESTERWSEFVEVTRKLVKVTKDRNVKALLYFKCGSVMEAKFDKEEDAIRYYDAAIKTSPACLPAVHGLRDLYLRRKDWTRVIQTLELEVKLWQDDKERAGVFAQIGRLYEAELHEPERAMHYFESALAVDPDCVPANKALFEQYFDQKQWDRAQPLAQALAQKAMRDGDPTARSEFYRKRGIVARYTGDPSAAAESIIIALEIKPTNLEALEALTELCESHYQAYDFPATFRELEKIYRKRDDAQALLARVMVAQAFERRRQGDLEAAEELFASALDRSPADFAIVSSLVDLHVSMRSWEQAVAVIGDYLANNDVAEEIRITALMRQAEIHSDGEMDLVRAVEVLTQVIALQPDDLEAHYRLAQELYCLGRYGDAREAIERVIALAAAPGTSVSPARLSRYYYYLGRIIESSGDSRAAASQYRRAAEYDPGYGPPALALAKRAVAAGDQQGAETTLINAAHAAMEQGDEHSAVPLQRGLARILLAAGDRAAAIEAYRGILAVEADPADRFALAEIYADDDLPKAIGEVHRVIAADLRHAPAYRMLASFYARGGDVLRAGRVYSAMELLGYAEEQDRRDAANVRSMINIMPLRNSVDPELRSALLVTSAMSSTLGELFIQASKELTMLFPQPPLGDNLGPLQSVQDPTFPRAVADVSRLFNFEPEIYLGDGVPRGLVALSHPRPIVVLDRGILGESDAARRFLLGYAFEAVRGGYALLLSLGQRQRQELGTLMRSLFLPESERSAPTNDFVRALSPAAIATLRRHEGQCQDVDTDEWIDGMIATARRAGVVACDDFSASARAIAILGGETVSVGAEGTALGTVLCGEDLFRFFVGDAYHRLRDNLSRPTSSRAV